jgi:hypothetical protein
MGKINLYKITPNGWDSKRNYLIAKKNDGKLSNGTILIRYEVLLRCSIQGYEKKLKKSTSLNGVEYTANELFCIEEYKCSDTEKDIICGNCNECDFGFEISYGFF